MASGPRETVYDDEIAPLMEQIISLCKQNGIPVVASFELDPDEEGPLYVTTRILPPGSAERLIKAGHALYGPDDVDVG